jgi:hypothetical protein
MPRIEAYSTVIIRIGYSCVATFTRANDKSVMPDKRRLQISEMNATFAHPWFAGCQSASVTHLPGKHRLTGCEYWAPVAAAYGISHHVEFGRRRCGIEIRVSRFPVKSWLPVMPDKTSKEEHVRATILRMFEGHREVSKKESREACGGTAASYLTKTLYCIHVSI